MSALAHPEGIERRHVRATRRARFAGLPLGMIGLGVLLAASILGLFGREASRSASGDGASVAVHGPASIRNGEFFEMTVTVEADRDLEEVVLLVGEDVWRDVTVNTFIPAPSEETFGDGSFRFAFGELRAGERLLVKIDCQVNPDHTPSANRGRVTIADGETELVAVEYVMEVLP